MHMRYVSTFHTSCTKADLDERHCRGAPMPFEGYNAFDWRIFRGESEQKHSPVDEFPPISRSSLP
ncbi:hypothetical protein TcasGA2_TC014004 [Tribolium castaneum]|uniref:Uncharacterized protein n=1 Tax=Tribolium castaneum TaxID=7070 RepID=D6WJ51_TRICA|nr:hypothetical protein TcasGA2_TC014004 [Tribolium castaneum]